MKNKKVTYLLICLVAALWGGIFYRIFAQAGEGESMPLRENKPKTAYFKLVDHSLDQVTLNTDYNDPFERGQTGAVEEALVISTAVTKMPKMPVPKPIVNWPVIIYSGRIFNPSTKHSICILSINGKEVMMETGEQVAGVKLSADRIDSVRVEYQGSGKYLHIK